MIIGKVISKVVSTRKHDRLQGFKFLVIETCFCERKELFVAADELGAGEGEFVLVVKGEPTQYALGKQAPIDAIIVGILDNEPVLKA